MKTRLLITLFLLFIISSCKKETFPETNRSADELSFNNVQNSSGQLKIAVVSDIHYMDPSLLANGAENGYAFQMYLAQDPKLLEYSDAIFRETITRLNKEKPHIVLVPGDITKDGEKVCHESVVNLLKTMLDPSIKVYVIPGNHDIKNPDAKKFDGNTSSSVPNISAADFANLYADFGYSNAISRDIESLSYITEPFPKVWILGIDDNKYYEYTNETMVNGGVIKPATMQWIHEKMAIAKEQNITVIPFMHHGLVEHYTNQNMFDPGYVTDNWEATADALMADGLKVIFTGHYHANDVTPRTSAGNTIYDVETGSLVSAPSPFRIMMLKNKELDISTSHITSIDYPLPGNMDFVSFSNNFYSGHLDLYFTYALMQPPFSLDYSLASSSAPLCSHGFMAHIAGDEKISPAEQRLDDNFAAICPYAGMALYGFWNDLGIKDNKLHIKIGTP